MTNASKVTLSAFRLRAWERVGHICVTGSLALGLLAGHSMSQAQAVYRIVSPDGKITFSDQPPSSASQGKVEPRKAGTGEAGSGNFPFALRQAVGKYPVTLYTANDCSPCSAARAMLTRRGVPFTERTISTQEDLDSLKRLTGEGTVPVATIGSQRLRGFSDVEWAQTLSAAGYPEASQLPPGYRQAPPTPLVAIAPAPAPKEEEKRQPVLAPFAPVVPASPGAPVENPAGIKF